MMVHAVLTSRNHEWLLNCLIQQVIIFFISTSTEYCFFSAGSVGDSIFPTSGQIYFLSGDSSGTITVNILPLDFQQGFKVSVI